MIRRFEAPHLIDAMDVAARYNAFLFGEVLRGAKGARTVLDFGAGNGRFSIALSERGFDVHAVEPDPTLRERIAQAGIITYGGPGDLEGRRFDYIFSLNVLEHIEDDQLTMEWWFSRLCAGGRLLLYVPALKMLWTANDERVGHRRRYSRRTLLPRLRSVGFEIERAHYVDSLGVLAAVAYRVVGDRSGELNPRSIRLYDRLAFPLSRALDTALRGVVGKNLLVEVVRPPPGGEEPVNPPPG